MLCAHTIWFKLEIHVNHVSPYEKAHWLSTAIGALFICKYFTFNNHMTDWLYVLIMPHTCFRMNPHSSCLNVKELLDQNRCDIWSLSDCKGTQWLTLDLGITGAQSTRLTTRLNHLASLTWVFLYKVSGCGFESCCSHLNFRYCTCFKQGVHWHSSNYTVWIHSRTHTRHAKNIQSNVPCR